MTSKSSQMDEEPLETDEAQRRLGIMDKATFQQMGCSADEQEEIQRIKAYGRRSLAVADMSKEEIDEMLAGRMASEHNHLNVLLDKE